MTDFEADKTSRKLSAGELVFEQGDSSSSFFMLQSGQLNVLRNEKRIDVIEKAETPFGSPGLYLELERYSTIEASEPSEIDEYEFSPGKMLEWLVEHTDPQLIELRNTSRMLDHVNRKNKLNFSNLEKIKPAVDSTLIKIKTLLKKYEDLTVRKPLSDLFKHQSAVEHWTHASPKNEFTDFDSLKKFHHSFKEGEIVCKKGHTGDKIYFLIEGILSVHLDDQQIATIDQPGTLFGEMAAFMDGQRTTTVRCESNVRLVGLPVKKLPTLFEKSPELSRSVTKMLFTRYEEALNLDNHLSQLVELIQDTLHNPIVKKEMHNAITSLFEQIEDEKSPDGETKEIIKELRKRIRRRNLFERPAVDPRDLEQEPKLKTFFHSHTVL